jgi:diguanylate cyclase (GGDEF)-like protein
VRLNAAAGFRVDLVPALQMIDPQVDTLDAQTAWLAVERGDMAPLTGANPSFGFIHGVRWFHLRIANDDHPAQRWQLVIEQPRIDEILIHARDQVGEYRQYSLGDRLPFAARGVAHRYPNVELALPRGSALDILVGVRSTSSIQLPLRLYTPTELWAASHDEQAGLGLYYGILLALFLYNLAVLASIRDASYAYYLAYLAAFGLLMLAFNGLGFQYLWPDATTWQSASLPVSIGAVLCTSLLFARSFLDLRQRVPRVARLFDWAVPLFALLTLLAFTRWQLQVTQLLNIGVIVFGVVVTVSAVISGRSGYRPAWYFLLAWGLLIAGGVALPLSSFGLLPRSTVTEYGLQIGSALEMLLLSFSLAYRIHLLRAEKETIEHEARHTLEARVAERTRELAATARQLSLANAQLEDVNRRDGLTGVYNRRHLDEAIRGQWQIAAESGRSLALLMLDIDHFKSINDQHGHGAGDDCLRVLGRLLEGCFPEHGVTIARYGGEEFTVVLPEHDLDMALQRAEQLRLAIAARPFETEAGAIAITVSIGVAAIEPPAIAGASELRKRSDEALFAAKRSGRNRVAAG